MSNTVLFSNKKEDNVMVNVAITEDKFPAIDWGTFDKDMKELDELFKKSETDDEADALWFQKLKDMGIMEV